MANRIHIGFFGKRNSGKSTLINTFAGYEVSIVSDVAGTTTDPVYKSMEIYPLGACVIIDTAGFDDVGDLGEKRIAKTKVAAEKADIAIMIFTGEDVSLELDYFKKLIKKETPTLAIINSFGKLRDFTKLAQMIEDETGLKPLILDVAISSSREAIRSALSRMLPENYGEYDITGSLVHEGDKVLLVMPQDIQAPRGRLILPQVQTIRELLDKKCVVISVTADKVEAALSALKEPPKLIITDSQLFGLVYKLKPQESLLTSFSVLYAALKGDIHYYIEGAAAIDTLTENSRVLIAECCTHAPLEEDIGRVKIPKFLRKRIGEGLTVDIASGTNFPSEPSTYDLIIQCGACMFNRKYVLTRIDRAREAGVPMTNYGITIAYLNGILDHVALPD